MPTAIMTVFVLSLHVDEVVDKSQDARWCVGVQEGSCVLVHSAAGGCGMNALAICLAVGATPVGTVGTPDKVSACSLDTSHCFASAMAAYL